MADTGFLALVRGRVQGVGFRYHAKREADSLGVAGWVRNTDSGDVEVWAEGPEEAQNQFLTWLRSGPPWSKVTDVKVQRLPASGKYKRFSVEY